MAAKGRNQDPGAHIIPHTFLTCFRVKILDIRGNYELICLLNFHPDSGTIIKSTLSLLLERVYQSAPI